MVALHRPAFWDCVLIAVVNTCNGVFIVLASPGERTPPLIQGVIGNLTVCFSYPLSVWLLRERRSLRDWRPVVSLALVVVSTVVSLWPETTATINGSGGNIAWSLIYLLGAWGGGHRSDRWNAARGEDAYRCRGDGCVCCCAIAAAAVSGIFLNALCNVQQAWWANRLRARLAPSCHHGQHSAVDSLVSPGGGSTTTANNNNNDDGDESETTGILVRPAGQSPTPPSTNGTAPSLGCPGVDDELAVSLHLSAWQCMGVLVFVVAPCAVLDFVPWLGQAGSWPEFRARVGT